MGKSVRRDVSDCVAMRRNGKLPVPAEQLPTGTLIVHPPQTPAIDRVAIYARVSSADQKAYLERQLGRLAEFASRERLMVVRSVSEIGCGLNADRNAAINLMKFAASSAMTTCGEEGS